MTDDFRLDIILETKTDDKSIKDTKEFVESAKRLERTKDKLPWVDKYRPKHLDEVIEQKEVVKVLKQAIKTGNMPHLLLYGPPGTGKTSVIIACALQMFGPKIFDERVIELNASDERGIGVVRGKITTFAKMSIGTEDPRYPCPPFKLIILDEADAMTTEAQSALRKVMEDVSGITRFCLICNYINQIIDPIASRCMKFRFKPVNPDTMTEKLKNIAEKEKIRVEDDSIFSTISKIINGDMRRAIMILQNLKYIKKPIISSGDILDITGYVPEKYISKLWKLCFNSEISLKSFILKIIEFRKYGYSFGSILNDLKEIVISDCDINDSQKSKIIIQLSMTEKRLIDGADEMIQLLNVFSYIRGIVQDKIKYVSKVIC